MPTVKNFGSYRIMLFAEDHNPPHVHVIGRAFQAKVRIRDGALMVGVIPLAIVARHWLGSVKIAIA